MSDTRTLSDKESQLLKRISDIVGVGTGEAGAIQKSSLLMQLLIEELEKAKARIKALELPDYDDTDPYQQGYMWAIGQAYSELEVQKERSTK